MILLPKVVLIGQMSVNSFLINIDQVVGVLIRGCAMADVHFWLFPSATATATPISSFRNNIISLTDIFLSVSFIITALPAK